MNSLRIRLGIVDRGMAGDDVYFLSIDKNGRWQVEMMRDFEQPYKTPRWSIIPEGRWDSIVIAGKVLRQHVEAAKI
jgi:hypothetical protein